MAIPRILYTDERTEENCNKGQKALWDIFKIEHDKDGDHKSDFLTAYDYFDTNFTYQGDGNPTQVISLGDASLDIKYLLIWDNVNLGIFRRSESMAADSAKDSGGELVVTTPRTPPAIQTGYITAVGTGSFTVGTNLNTNLQDYYYIAIGVH